MNRKTCDVSTKTLLDIIGTYFIDVFYNNHYLMACDEVRKKGQYSSITDCYRSIVMLYMNGVGQNKQYAIVARKVCEYYHRNSGFSSSSFIDFENRALSCFIPVEYYGSFSEAEKDKTLMDIIKRAVNSLGEFVLKTNVLKKIIDDHKNTENVSMLQDKMLNILLLIRDDYYEKFAEQIAGDNINNNYSHSLVRKLTSELYDITRAKTSAEDDRDRALNIIKQLIIRNNSAEKNIDIYTLRVNELTNQLKEANEVISDLRKEISNQNTTSKLPLYAPPVDIPKVTIPKVDNFKVDNPKTDIPKVTIPKVDSPKTDIPKVTIPKTDNCKVDNPKTIDNVQDTCVSTTIIDTDVIEPEHPIVEQLSSDDDFTKALVPWQQGTTEQDFEQRLNDNIYDDPW